MSGTALWSSVLLFFLNFADFFVRFLSQILPRYIVHFDEQNQLAPLPAVPAAVPQTDVAFVLWIDPDQSGYNRSLIDRSLFVSAAPPTIVQVSSSAEAREWFLRDVATVRALIAADRLRVITNRYRKGDGDELAGANWIDWMRAEEQQQYHSVPLLLFCSQEGYSRVSGLHNPGKRVIVTASEEEAIRFASFQTTFAPEPRPGLLTKLSSFVLGSSK